MTSSNDELHQLGKQGRIFLQLLHTPHKYLWRAGASLEQIRYRTCGEKRSLPGSYNIGFYSYKLNLEKALIKSQRRTESVLLGTRMPRNVLILLIHRIVILFIVIFPCFITYSPNTTCIMLKIKLYNSTKANNKKAGVAC